MNLIRGMERVKNFFPSLSLRVTPKEGKQEVRTKLVKLRISQRFNRKRITTLQASALFKCKKRISRNSYSALQTKKIRY